MDGFILGDDEYDIDKIGYYRSFEGRPPQPIFYGLDGKPCTPRTIENLRESGARFIAQQAIGKWWVSTVHLGSDHNWLGEGPPIVFETMVFPIFEEQRPCSTCLGSGEFDWSANGIIEENIMEDGSHITDCFSCEGTGIRQEGEVDMGEAYCKRYATMEQARDGHSRVVTAIMETGEPPS